MTIDQGSLADLATLIEDEAVVPATGIDAEIDADTVVVENRFGRFQFDRQNAIIMPRGLPGFPHEHEFALANLPDPRLENVKLLQSLQDPTLSFLVAPLNVEASMLDPKDVAAALAEHSIAQEDAALLLIITVRNDPDTGVQITANMRAPLIIDTASRTAHQHVFTNEKYPIRHPLNLAA